MEKVAFLKHSMYLNCKAKRAAEENVEFLFGTCRQILNITIGPSDNVHLDLGYKDHTTASYICLLAHCLQKHTHRTSADFPQHTKLTTQLNKTITVFRAGLKETITQYTQLTKKKTKFSQHAESQTAQLHFNVIQIFQQMHHAVTDVK